MRIFVLIIALVFSFACTDKETEKNVLHYYFVGPTGKITTDTIHSYTNQQAAKVDELLAQDIFTYNKINHVIKLYTSDNHAPVDGGHLYYTLDGIGVIYERSTTWPGFSRLKTNNDSINDLIDQAFAHILQNSHLHCYLCNLVDTTTMTFVPPIIKDE